MILTPCPYDPINVSHGVYDAYNNNYYASVCIVVEHYLKLYGVYDVWHTTIITTPVCVCWMLQVLGQERRPVLPSDVCNNNYYASVCIVVEHYLNAQ